MVDVTELVDDVKQLTHTADPAPIEPRVVLDRGATEVLVRVACEMRQPLSAVTAAITLIRDNADTLRREQAYGVLEHQCTRLSQLVEDLLVVARTGQHSSVGGNGRADTTQSTLPAPAARRELNPPASSPAHEHVRRMLDRIEQSYAEPITLRSLAAELHRQSAYLGGMFRRIVGMSVHQWLTTVRLDRASVLIRDGVKVEAVSLLVGYRSKKNFYRQFKRRFGTTPYEYRHTAGTER